ncbi:MAG: extracellular solute-binding protein [Treponema sp.]|nr:extracellular solute-binding protein [Treponema sp.]
MSKSNLLKLALAVMFIAAAACVWAGGGQASGGSAAAPGAKKSFSIINAELAGYGVPPDIDVNNNKWNDIFKKNLPDIDITWIIVPPNSMQDRLNVMIGAGEQPDVFPMTMAQMIQWSDIGVIQNIDGMYDKYYKNIYNFLTADDLKPTRYNGHTYGIMAPDNRLQNPTIMSIRADWLDNLGLTMPKSIDELYNVLRAFTFDDPDGNGKNDTYGIAGCFNGNTSFNYMWEIFSMFGVQQGTNFTQVGNQILPDFIRPEMRSAVEFLARLYREGIMDKDTLVMNIQQLEAKSIQGILGMYGNFANGYSVRVIPTTLASNPNAKIELFTPPPAPDGKVFLPVGRNGTGMRGVSSKCTNVDAVMTFFNWIIEQDMSKLPYYSLNCDKIYLGLDEEGALGTYCVDLGGKYYMVLAQNLQTPAALSNQWRMGYRTLNGTIQALPDDLIFESMQMRIDQGQSRPIHLEAMKQTAQYGRPNAAAITGPVWASHANDITTYWEETISSIVSGAKPITAFDDFVKFFYANEGQKIIDETTALNK